MPGRGSTASMLALGCVAPGLVTRATRLPASTPSVDEAAIGTQSCGPSIRGGVIRGQDFERSFGDDLAFRLAATRSSPPNPRVWTIEIRPRRLPEHPVAVTGSCPVQIAALGIR